MPQSHETHRQVQQQILKDSSSHEPLASPQQPMTSTLPENGTVEDSANAVKTIMTSGKYEQFLTAKVKIESNKP